LLSNATCAATLRSIFSALDTDKNGVLTLKEFEESLLMLPQGANPAAVFDAFINRIFVDDAEGSHTVGAVHVDSP
jgi:Ca2+-binding EF-hand superfamily protein